MRAVLRVVVAVLAALPCFSLANGEDVVAGGISPNGRYEVRLWTEPLWDPADFEVRIFDETAGAYLRDEGRFQERDRKGEALREMVVFWCLRGDWLALWDRRGLGLRLLTVADGAVKWVEVPALEDGWKVDWPLCWEGARLRVRVTRNRLVPGETAERWLESSGRVGWKER
ncbi:MAG: hypothetical protein RLZZ253_443 [Verrucomicrobiota bacterium]|jgi:hypothetical protein